MSNDTHGHIRKAPGDVKEGQRYQNTFKYKHNTRSAKTEKIANSPLDKLCQRCYEQLLWKMDYRKYKPLVKPRKCNACGRPHVLKAYRIICDPCALKGKKDGVLLCTKCTQNVKTMPYKNAGGRAEYAVPSKTTKKDEQKCENAAKELEDALSKLRLRERGAVERKIEAGEIKHKRGVGFVYTDNEEAERTLGDSDKDKDSDADNEGADIVKNKKSVYNVEESKQDIVVDENGCPVDSNDSDEDMDDIFEGQDQLGVKTPAATQNDQADDN